MGSFEQENDQHFVLRPAFSTSLLSLEILNVPFSATMLRGNQCCEQAGLSSQLIADSYTLTSSLNE
jgi:hypothetical protein